MPFLSWPLVPAVGLCTRSARMGHKRQGFALVPEWQLCGGNRRSIDERAATKQREAVRGSARLPVATNGIAQRVRQTPSALFDPSVTFSDTSRVPLPRRRHCGRFPGSRHPAGTCQPRYHWRHRLIARSSPRGSIDTVCRLISSVAFLGCVARPLTSWPLRQNRVQLRRHGREAARRPSCS